MTKDVRGYDEFDLDKALHTIEREIWGRFLETTQEIRPRPEFARDLEARLLASMEAQASKPVQAQVQATAPLLERPKAAPWPRRLFRRGGLRLSLVGAGVGVAMVALLVVSVFLSGGGTTSPSDEELMSKFVPPGKVRHLVISETTTSEDAPFNQGDSRTWDVWYANGQKHLLMYTTFSTGDASPFRTILVTDESVYDRETLAGETIFYKYPYNERYVAMYAPDRQIISRTLSLRNSQILGDHILNGRSTMVIESVTDSRPVEKSESDVGERYILTHRIWIDKAAYRPLQWQYLTTYISGPNTGKVTDNIATVIVDELKDVGELPADFFTFKLPEGARLLERKDPLAETPTPAPANALLANAKNEFVPAGTVRHLVIMETTTLGAERSESDQVRIWDEWYANGPNHMVMYVHVAASYTSPGTIEGANDDTIIRFWVEDLAMYRAVTAVGRNATFEKYPYSPALLMAHGPDPEIITNTLKRPNARIIGNSEINSRPVVLLESTSSPSGSDLEVYRVWVDPEAHRAYQWQNEHRDSKGITFTQTQVVVLDELIEASKFPPDFFKFKLPEGATLVESGSYFEDQATPTVVP